MISLTTIAACPMLKTSKAISSNQLKPTKNESFMRMKKLAMLSIGMLAFALQPANAQTSLFTTYDDFSAFSAGWGAAPSAVNTFSTDASTINGIGNLTAPGAAGTSGSLLITAGVGGPGPSGGGLWTDAATGPSQGGNTAFLQAIDPGTDGINAVNASGNIYMDYSLPDNEGGTYFDVGVLFQYAGNGYFGTFFATSSTDLGFTDPSNGGEVYQATIPYTITGGSAFSGFGFGIMLETDYASALPFTVDNITVSVPEPGTLALMGLGLTGLAIIRRRRQS
ncbi:MAG: PEP-CTERM sorting domain-containing protein [Limisphaerales bacterium]